MQTKKFFTACYHECLSYRIAWTFLENVKIITTLGDFPPWIGSLFIYALRSPHNHASRRLVCGVKIETVRKRGKPIESEERVLSYLIVLLYVNMLYFIFVCSAVFAKLLYFISSIHQVSESNVHLSIFIFQFIIRLLPQKYLDWKMRMKWDRLPINV